LAWVIELPHEKQNLNAWVNLGLNFRYFFVQDNVPEVFPGIRVPPGGAWDDGRALLKLYSGPNWEGRTPIPIVLIN
jgi:hypothetical protein